MNNPVTAPALGDISRCPLGVRCECCGAEGDDVAVLTVGFVGLGVACLTMCGRCASSAASPPVAGDTAARLVMQHLMHLGVTADDMRSLLDHGSPSPRETPR